MPLFGAPANSAAILVGGIRFYLIGRDAAPTAPVIAKFQAAMQSARSKLASAVAALAANPLNLSAEQELVLEFSFAATPAQRANTLRLVRQGLEQTLLGLRTADLYIYEPDLAALRAGAEGYVGFVLGVAGSIHTRFDLSNERTVHNLIHEATHKFIGTGDNGYIGESLAVWLRVRGLGIPGPAPITNARALTNADSFATLAANLT